MLSICFYNYIKTLFSLSVGLVSEEDHDVCSDPIYGLRSFMSTHASTLCLQICYEFYVLTYVHQESITSHRFQCLFQLNDEVVCKVYVKHISLDKSNFK